MKKLLILMPLTLAGAFIGCPAPTEDPPATGSGGQTTTGSGGQTTTGSGGQTTTGSGGQTTTGSGGQTTTGSGGQTTGSGGQTTGSGGQTTGSGGQGTGGQTTGSGGQGTGGRGGSGTGGATTGTGGAATGGRGGSGTGGAATGGRGGSGTGGAASGGSTGTGGAAPGDAMAVGMLFQGQAWVLRCGPLNGGTQRVCSNTMTIASNNLSHDNPLAGGVNRNDFTNAGGTAGADYCVTIRVQGIAEAKQYVNDTITNRSGTPYGVTGNIAFGNTTDASADGTNGWAVGGMPTANGDYNVYAILVDSPRQIYYLNSINTSGTNRQNHSSYAFSYNASFNIKGGSRVQFIAADYNRNAINNCADPIVESQCNPLPNINPLPTPLQAPTGTTINVTQPIMGQLITTTLVSARAGTCTCTNPATCS